MDIEPTPAPKRRGAHVAVRGSGPGAYGVGGVGGASWRLGVCSWAWLVGSPWVGGGPIHGPDTYQPTNQRWDGHRHGLFIFP